MSLVIAGNHSLNQLQKMAVENFSQIKDKNLSLKDYTNH